MPLSFPIRDRATPGLPATPGYPGRAHHCACVGGPMMFAGHDECFRCGQLPRDTIASTWSKRAQDVKAAARRRGR